MGRRKMKETRRVGATRLRGPFKRTPQGLLDEEEPEYSPDEGGRFASLWPVEAHRPPTAAALRNAMVCLRECEKRGFAPQGMGPASLDHGIMLFFHNFTFFCLEFLNGGEVWLTFAVYTPKQLAKEAERNNDPRYLRLSEALEPIMDRGIVQPMPNRFENLVSWNIKAEDKEIQRVLGLIRDIALMRITIFDFVAKLAPQIVQDHLGFLDRQKEVDIPEESE